MHEDDSFYVVALNEDFSFEVIGYEAQKYAVYGLQEDETPIGTTFRISIYGSYIS